MRFGSVCSGIEAASVAWHPLGWKPAFYSEIEKFPREVLAHHYPDVPLHGDFTTIGENEYGSIELLVGGTPCQSFSIAGLRKGLSDERGNLALQYLKLAQRERPRWLVWENVPGVLSSNGGRDFGCFLGGLVKLGYGFSYRVLDAQYFGVAQRRRRVFVVGHLGDWRPSAAVLFERQSLSGDIAPSREARKAASGQSVECFAGSNQTETASTLETTCHDYSRSDNFNCIAFPAEMSSTQSASAENISPCLSASHKIAFAQNQRDEVRELKVAGALSAQPGMKQQTFAIQTSNTGANGKNYSEEVSQTLDRSAAPAIATRKLVRRLTPVECERLQGFPDGYTDIRSNTPDGPRYKALGNSMAVPVMSWIGQRIQEVDNLLKEKS